MDFKQIKKYWEERASSDTSAQSTTQDYFMREIETRVLRELVVKLKPLMVMDIGCGDARTTLSLASEFPTVSFYGGDYSQAMVDNANNNIASAGASNVRIDICDVAHPLPISNIDLVYTTRCLINLPTWNLQKQAIKHIYDALTLHGHYVMIENFIEGQNHFNQVRMSFDLPPIPIRSHNLFFERAKFLDAISSMFEVIEDINISSTYYLVSRVIYSRICKDNSLLPDYFDEHHRYASYLPFSGEFGPVRMICMRKK